METVMVQFTLQTYSDRHCAKMYAKRDMQKKIVRSCLLNGPHPRIKKSWQSSALKTFSSNY